MELRERLFSRMYRPWRLANVVMEEEETTDEVSLQEKHAFLVLNMRHCSTELHTHTRTHTHTYTRAHTHAHALTCSSEILFQTAQFISYYRTELLIVFVPRKRFYFTVSFIIPHSNIPAWAETVKTVRM